MSVVDPRAAWTEEEETFLQHEADKWRKRWFVKPGLTGLAQINDAKSTDPETKLRYDVRYIREQSFWLDLKIVTRQIWMVVRDVLWMVGTRAGVVAASESAAEESAMSVESESAESELVEADRVADGGDD